MNEGDYRQVIVDLKDKYGLTQWQIETEFEKTLSEILHRWLGQKVVVFLNGGLQVMVYEQDEYGLQTQKILSLHQMRGWNTILKNVCRNLEKASCLDEINRLNTLKRKLKILWGTVVKIHENYLLVEVEIYDFQITRIAWLKKKYLSCKDRDRLIEGDRYAFHIRKILPINLRGTSKVGIYLDRVSKNLVYGLFKENGYSVKVLKRYVGNKTFIESKSFIPKSIIKEISDEIKEPIKVIVKRK